MARPRKEQPKHSSGMYEYKATVGHTFDGKPIRKSFYSNTSKAAAKAKAEEYIINSKVAEQTGEAFCPNSATFEKQAETVLKLKKGTVRENTYELHWVSVIRNHLLPYFGKAKLSDIRKNDVELYLKSKSNMASSTLETHMSVLNAIFENAVDNDVIPKNPCANVKISVGKAPAQKKVYTPEQADLILDYSKNHRFGLEIDLLLNYGLTRSELLGIMWDDIDFDRRVIYIRHDVTNAQGKNRTGDRVVVDDTKNSFRRRAMAVSEETIQRIKNHPRIITVGRNEHKKRPGTQVETEFLIYNQFGNVCSPDNWFNRHYKVFMREMHEFYLNQDPPIDVPMLNPHELRHTRTSIWVNAGKNLFAVAQQMGWADLDMLRKRYAHGDIDELRKQLDL